MNCKDIQELLPLYVGHDLPAKRASLIATHVRSCVQCASVEDEYRESRQLLQLFAPPVLKEGLYDGIRSRVLRQIEEESSVSPVTQLFGGLFRPRLRWAFAAALLLVFGFAFYFIANRKEERRLANTNSTQDVTRGNKQPVVGSNGPDLAATPLPDHTTVKHKEVIVRNTGPHKVSPFVPQPKQTGTSVASDNRRNSVTVNPPDAGVLTAEASPNNGNPIKPETVPAGDSSSAEKTIRVEMQTKDRNIRIIWFSHQSTKQDFPTKSSEGI